MHQLTFNPATKQGRRQLVTMALNLTADTALSPKEYERRLLDQFIQGELTIDQILSLLKAQERA